MSGLLLLTMTAPNTLQLLGKFTGRRSKFDFQVRSAASRLAHKGLARFAKRDGKTYLEITDAGKRALAMEQERSALEARAKKRWDKRWRMVIFDIPEKYRKSRVRLRIMLRSLGFMQLQASVWVYPYDCEEIITLIKLDLKTGANVLYTIVEKIEFDERIRGHFKLH